MVRLAAEVREVALPCEECRPVLRPTKCPFPTVIAGAFLGAKKLGREADHSPPSFGPRSRMRGAVPPLPICFHGVHKENFTFTFTSRRTYEWKIDASIYTVAVSLNSPLTTIF